MYYYVCTPEDDITNVETCRDNNEFKLISRTCVIIDCYFDNEQRYTFLLIFINTKLNSEFV
jgi:hypothetical protein